MTGNRLEEHIKENSQISIFSPTVIEEWRNSKHLGKAFILEAMLRLERLTLTNFYQLGEYEIVFL